MLRAHLAPGVLFLLALQLANPVHAQQREYPHAEISNGLLKVSLYLPDSSKGFYIGTRFDWSGVIRSLEYAGHNYYGPWFTKTDPDVIDFVFKGPDIIAGPCSAITGPVEEFSSHEKALGFDDAKAGGTFIKIGVGVLRKPDAQAYNPYRLYKIVDGGKWQVRTAADSVEFVQEVNDGASGYGYRYTKTVRLAKGKPGMTLEHTLENTGRRPIATSVYDHNFLVLDKQPIGPDFMLTLPFTIDAGNVQGAALASISGRQFTYRKNITGEQTVAAQFGGFANTPNSYQISVENLKVGAGVKILGDRPLSKEALWSIRSILAIEPFIDMSIDPGHTFTWKYDYTYFTSSPLPDR